MMLQCPLDGSFQPARQVKQAERAPFRSSRSVCTVHSSAHSDANITSRRECLHSAMSVALLACTPGSSSSAVVEEDVAQRVFEAAGEGGSALQATEGMHASRLHWLRSMHAWRQEWKKAFACISSRHSRLAQLACNVEAGACATSSAVGGVHRRLPPRRQRRAAV